MKNYLSADFHRIMTKKIRIILILLLGIADLIWMFMRIPADSNAIQATSEVGRLDLIYVNILMLSNLLISFGDDIHAKSMQAALGSGIKRHQIVLAKWLNLVLLSAIDIGFLTFLQFIPLLMMKRLASSFVIWSVIFGQISAVLSIALVSALTMIVLFQTQKALLGVFAYVYLTMNLTSGIVSIAATNPLVQRFQLWNIGAVSQMETFLFKLMIGQFDFRNFILVVLYFALGLGGAIYLFRKKELDF